MYVLGQLGPVAVSTTAAAMPSTTIQPPASKFWALPSGERRAILQAGVALAAAGFGTAGLIAHARGAGKVGYLLGAMGLMMGGVFGAIQSIAEVE